MMLRNCYASGSHLVHDIHTPIFNLCSFHSMHNFYFSKHIFRVKERSCCHRHRHRHHHHNVSTTTATTSSSSSNHTPIQYYYHHFENDIASIPLRSVLYVPASNTRALEKVNHLFLSSPETIDRSMRPDAIMYDLEDGVLPAKKEEARNKLQEHLIQTSSSSPGKHDVEESSIPDTTARIPMRNHCFGLVRINRMDTSWFHDDAAMALSMVLDETNHIHGVVLPKIEGMEDVEFVAQHFRSLVRSSNIIINGNDHSVNSSTLDESSVLSPIPLWAMIETPRAVLSASEIACQASIQGLIIGTNDLSKDLRLRPTSTSMMRTRDSSSGGGGDSSSMSSYSSTFSFTPRMSLLTSLQLTVLAARAHNKIVIDGVCNNIASDADSVDSFRRECLQGKEWGMDGKTLIHPNQIYETNKIFSPSREEIEYARRVIACWESATDQSRSTTVVFTGVAVMDGVMIEQLHVDAARKLLQQHEKIYSTTS